jgi:menaquinone-dependent protoporphyrinogen oxidase
MRILIAVGSKLGGTWGIGEMLSDTLRAQGHTVNLLRAERARDTQGYDAAIVGGALYANRWHRSARRFVARSEKMLRRMPVWFFSSGPLDDSAAGGAIGPVGQVEALMERVGAQGHATFGGRLAPDARGFPAYAMAKTNAGDWRKPDEIRAWAMRIAQALPSARPKPIVAQPGRSVGRLALHALTGVAASALLLGLFLWTTRPVVAWAVHGSLAPILFAVIAWHYFRARGARNPLPTAALLTALTAAIDAALLAGVMRQAALLSAVGFWLPLVLVFFVVWATGALMSTMPWPKPQLR